MGIAPGLVGLSMLTDTKITAAKPGEKAYKIADENGLYLFVKPNGSKLWRHKNRFEGKAHTGSYGPYPEVTLREARDARDSTRADLRAGKDPALEQRKVSALSTTHTFESLAREWHDLSKSMD